MEPGVDLPLGLDVEPGGDLQPGELVLDGQALQVRFGRGTRRVVDAEVLGLEDRGHARVEGGPSREQTARVRVEQEGQREQSEQQEAHSPCDISA